MSAPRICAECGTEVGGFHSYEPGWKCDDCRRASYATVCFVVELTPEVRRNLSILDDGSIETNADSISRLTALSITGHSVFGVAELGVSEWAEIAGADPSLWEEFIAT